MGMISWNNKSWSYHKYNTSTKEFNSLKRYQAEAFKFYNKCENNIWTIDRSKDLKIKTYCLRHSTICSATKELTANFIDGKEVQLHAKNPCQFPFIYKNVTYNSCTKKDHDKFWCATTVDATNHKTSWGYCSDPCSMVDE